MKKFEMTGEELKRRVDKVSMLRETCRKLREAALEAYERGEFPHKPKYDVRTDYEYWKKLSDEKKQSLTQTDSAH